MLQQLTVENIAIIQNITIDFSNELNIVTGETGAGKTILINAVKYLLGARFNKDSIRTGEARAFVEGVFSKDGKVITVRRVFDKYASSRSFINDAPVSVSELRLAIGNFVDMHGQHDQQFLLDTNNHLHYLDSFSENCNLLQQFQKSFSQVKSLLNKLDSLKNTSKELQEKEELFRFQLQELELFELSENSDINLSQEYEQQVNATEIIQQLTNIEEELLNGEHSVVGVITKNKRELEKFSDTQPKLKILSDRLQSTQIELADVIADATSFKNTIHFDNEKLDQLSEKLSHVEMLKRKYGGSMQTVLDYKISIINSLSTMNSRSIELDKLNKKLLVKKKHLIKDAKSLSNHRKIIAEKLENKILSNLKEVDMIHSKFTIKFAKNPDELITEKGIDECEFYISTNLGESLKPLVRIASGGEISRFMLAIKMAMQDKDTTNTLVFDEIDTGISGITAEKVGKVISKLGKSHQIICISHLPQIASKGIHHIKVYKSEKNGRTSAFAKKLCKDERLTEVASLICGEEITKSSLQQAQLMIKGNNG